MSEYKDPRIEIDDTICFLCGECAEQCHAGAIRENAFQVMVVDADRCDWCGCCPEFCEHGAITARYDG